MLEHAVVGKQPTLSPRSTAKREPLAPAELGDGTIVSTGAIVFAGASIGHSVLATGLGPRFPVRRRPRSFGHRAIAAGVIAAAIPAPRAAALRPLEATQYGGRSGARRPTMSPRPTGASIPRRRPTGRAGESARQGDGFRCPGPVGNGVP